MGIALIKKLNEKIPYWIKLPFSKLIRSRLIENKEFIITYNKLAHADKQNKNEILNSQFEQLRETLIHAYDHTKYYHKLFDDSGFSPNKIKSVDDIKNIPILTKKLLNEHFDDIQADDIDDYYTVTTGGTTGKPTKVFMENKAIYREWAFIYHFWSKYGYDYKKSRIATFRGVDLGKRLYEINPLYAEIRLNPFLMNKRNIRLYIKQIEKYKADFIYGYPSAVYNYCRLTKDAGIDIKHKFKAALLISENLYSFQEALITKVLDCPIAIFYGHSERAVFAERYDGGYVFNPMYGITELSDQGEPIVTGFINQKTPLIRYIVDDKVKPLGDELFSINGHHNADVIYGKEGEQVSMSAVNFHDDTFEGITGYQFLQEEAGKCTVLVTADSPLDLKKMNLIKSRLYGKLQAGFDISVKQVDELQKTSRGKYKMVIQNISFEKV